MDVVKEPGVEHAVFLKPAQIGGSEALRNCLGYWIDQNPGPCMVLMPDELSAKEIIRERFLPLIDESPRLRSHKTGKAWDTNATALRLDTMSVYAAWATSPQRLASRPIRYLLRDEIDKYPAFSGREADPLSLSEKRTRTYQFKRFIWDISTPTTRMGNIWRMWETAGDHRYYHVPCPHCGVYQRLVWSQVKWPKLDIVDTVKQAEKIKLDDLAWYECESCGEPIREQHKNKIMGLGKWVGDNQEVTPEGVVTGQRPKSHRVGFHINAIYSPWVRMSALASEFIMAQGNPAAMMDFRNSNLAEPFEEQASTTKRSVILDMRKLAGQPMVMPKWASLMIATADVQKDHLYYAIRAWGSGARSQLVRYGIVPGFDELRSVVFGTAIPNEVTGEAMYPVVLAIDSRYRSDEVFAFAQLDPGRIWPMAGAAQLTAAPIREQAIKGYPGVVRKTVNPNYWKDILHGYIHNEDQTMWLPHAEVGDDYAGHMSSEHKVMDPKARTWVWLPVSSGAQNHWWDCEVLQCVVAQLTGAHALPVRDEVTARQNIRRRRGWKTI